MCNTSVAGTSGPTILFGAFWRCTLAICTPLLLCTEFAFVNARGNSVLALKAGLALRHSKSLRNAVRIAESSKLRQKAVGECPKNGLLCTGINPSRNEFPGQQECIHECNPEKLRYESLLPRLGLPHPVQPQNVLPESIVPVHITHLSIVHPDDVRAIDPDVVSPPIIVLPAFQSLSTRFGNT